MAYKDKIYDITALEMFKRLELFLDEKLGGHEKMREAHRTVDWKIKEFTKGEKANRPDAEKRMNQLRKTRNDIVHPYARSARGKFRPHPEPILDLDKFREFQKICYSLDKTYPALRMKEIMIPTLKYQMGNAGDIIKHGLLAEFVQWYKYSKGGCLQFADPFGGSPWGNLDSTVAGRLTMLKDTAFPKMKDKYLGSSHLVRQVADDCGISVQIDISDNDKTARCNLENSILEFAANMKMIESLHENDGYRILDNSEKPGQYDLILIDPYSEFLRDEFIKDEHEHFSRILSLTEKYPDLFVAVFVLDMNPNNSIGKSFAEFKKEKLADCAFSLRCPKLSAADGNIVKGESGFDSEILLINAKIGDDKYRKLYEQLQHFAQQAAKALPLPAGKPLKLWGAGQEGTPDNPQEFSHK